MHWDIPCLKESLNRLEVNLTTRNLYLLVVDDSPVSIAKHRIVRVWRTHWHPETCHSYGIGGIGSHVHGSGMYHDQGIILCPPCYTSTYKHWYMRCGYMHVCIIVSNGSCMSVYLYVCVIVTKASCVWSRHNIQHQLIVLEAYDCFLLSSI